MEKKIWVRQRQENLFSIRVKSAGGNFSAEDFDTIQRTAKKFGAGQIHLTARQEISIHSIKPEDFSEVEKIFSESGLKVSPLGAGLKNITACQGNEICPSGAIDTARLAREIEKRLGEKNFPKKFTVGLSGCKNNCMRVEQNDLGIAGAVEPLHEVESCTYCGKCEKVCRAGAIKVSRGEKFFSLDRELCTRCGRCVRVCESALRGETGFVIYLGGKIFRDFVRDEEKLFEVIS